MRILISHIFFVSVTTCLIGYGYYMILHHLVDYVVYGFVFRFIFVRQTKKNNQKDARCIRVIAITPSQKKVKKINTKQTIAKYVNLIWLFVVRREIFDSIITIQVKKKTKKNEPLLPTLQKTNLFFFDWQWFFVL